MSPVLKSKDQSTINPQVIRLRVTEQFKVYSHTQKAKAYPPPREKINLNNRVNYFDNCRAICMLWIVGVWHLLDYGDHTSISGTAIGTSITTGVLAAFTFISGYFLGKSKVETRKDILLFWKKRLLRFYPLFFLSCTSLYLIHLIFGYNYITSFKQYILTLIGLSDFLGAPPLTVWYISMLMLYYFITPLIIKIGNLRKQIIIIAALYLALICLCTLKLGVYVKVIIHFPFYFVPVLFPEMMRRIVDRLNILSIIAAISVWLGIILIIHPKLYVYILILTSILILIALISLSKIIAKNELVNKVLYKVSYASMAAYLFHRQWYGMFVYIVNQFYRNEKGIPLWAAYIVMLPTLIVISYVTQQIYDKIVERCTHCRAQLKKLEMK